MHPDQAPAAAPPGTPRTQFALAGLLTGASVLSFVASFLPYYTYRARSVDLTAACGNIGALPAAYRAEFRAACSGISTDAWHGLFGWVSAVGSLLIALVATAFLLAGRRPRAVAPRLPLGLLPVAAVTVALTLAALLHVPDATYHGEQIRAASSTVAAGHAWGYWTGLVAGVAALFCTADLLRRQWTHDVRADAGSRWGGADAERVAGRLERAPTRPRRRTVYRPR